jgi:hypothetical protein
VEIQSFRLLALALPRNLGWGTTRYLRPNLDGQAVRAKVNASYWD